MTANIFSPLLSLAQTSVWIVSATRTLMIARDGKEALLKNNKLLFIRTFLLECWHSVGAGSLPLPLLMVPSGRFAACVTESHLILISHL